MPKKDRFIIVACGKEGKKIIEGIGRKATPFMGTDGAREFGSMGVGLLFSDGGKKYASLWGLSSPHLLIQSWRGMKILEHVETIDGSTFCACWYAGAHKPHSSDLRYLDELSKKLGGVRKLDALRKKVLASAPTSAELVTMIERLRKNGVHISWEELEEEANAGRIEMLPVISELRKEEKKKLEVYRRQEEKIKKPLLPEHSLGVFFAELGIDNFVDSARFGAYNWDWGHHELKHLDSLAKRVSIRKYSKNGFLLEHTTQGPFTESVAINSAMTVHSTSFGEFQKPYYVVPDGTRYTFISAKYRKDRFFLKTLIAKQNGEAELSEYTLSQLRKMIGPILLDVVAPAIQAPPSFLARVASFFK